VRRGPDPIGDSRPDWEILSAISVLMGYPLEYGDPKEILKEIRSVIPGYTVLGPMPEPATVDSPIMERYLAGGFAEDLADRYRPANAGRAEWTLRMGQTLFHSGKMSTMAKGLLEIQKEGRLHMNPADFERLGLHAGDIVRLTSEGGEATVGVSPLGRFPEGMVYFPESFREPLAPLLRVTPDPVTGVPYHKVQPIRVQKVK
jgi:predicted molibdopterin-dependent oxidoreductase YjgC